MYSRTIAIDLAKSVFELAVSDEPGRVSKRHRLTRSQWDRFIKTEAPSTLVMEACGTAHHWGRQAKQQGHRVVLLPPHAVRPYVLRNKTDGADAKALLEALRNQALHAVPVKTVDQQAIAGLHRLRSSWVATRTARINTVRGLLRELGFMIPLGAKRVVPQVRLLAEQAEEQNLPVCLRDALIDAADEIEQLEQRIAGVERRLEREALDEDTIRRLRTVAGVGLLTATALVGFVGDVKRFRSGREFSSYLGLTPRETSSGLQRRLGRISKRGDSYLRMLLVHGARSVLCHAKRHREPDRLRAWALSREQSRGHNKAAVALANKLARIVWAVWCNDTVYKARVGG